MPSERSRNFIVGLTILVALGVLIYGIFLLGLGKLSSPSQYEITLYPPDTNGIGGGVNVEFKGVTVGTVKYATLDKDADGIPRAHMALAINKNVDIPQNSIAYLSKPQIVGSNPSIKIEVQQGPPGAMLNKNGSGTLPALPADNGLIPRAVFDNFQNAAISVQKGADNLRKVADDLHVLIQYAPPESLNANDPAAPKENASTVIVRLDRTIASLQGLLSDPALQGKIRDAIGNIADASVQLKDTLAKISQVAQNADGAVTAITGAATKASDTLQSTQQEIARVSQKLVETLDALSSATKQITDGKGTTGLLINDPRLYNSLLDLSKNLKSTVDDLDFLLKKWKEEGVNIKL